MRLTIWRYGPRCCYIIEERRKILSNILPFPCFQEQRPDLQQSHLCFFTRSIGFEREESRRSTEFSLPPRVVPKSSCRMNRSGTSSLLRCSFRGEGQAPRCIRHFDKARCPCCRLFGRGSSAEYKAAFLPARPRLTRKHTTVSEQHEAYLLLCATKSASAHSLPQFTMADKLQSSHDSRQTLWRASESLHGLLTLPAQGVGILNPRQGRLTFRPHFILNFFR